MANIPTVQDHRNHLLSVLDEAVTAGVKVYLCGIDKYDCVGVRNQFITPKEVASILNPNVILLARATPDDTYQSGNAKGLYFRQLSDTTWEIPNLDTVKSVANDIGCLVAGLDMDKSKDRALIRKHNIKISRLTKMHDVLETRAEDFHAEGKKFSDKDYSELKALSSALVDNRLQTGGHPGEDSYHNLEVMSGIIKKSSHIIRKYFPARIIPEFNAFAKDFNKYAQKVDDQLYKNIMKHYDGKKRILCVLGAEHISGDARLIKNFKKSKTPFLEFVDYSDSKAAGFYLVDRKSVV